MGLNGRREPVPLEVISSMLRNIHERRSHSETKEFKGTIHKWERSSKIKGEINEKEAPTRKRATAPTSDMDFLDV